ncbi:Anaphase-promoting complex subunit 10 [Boothiomyces sp. JEL0838]|nr:Anaphase-promoting complex subunit 10 [Boothiomyces sp. JEL0838]
MPNPTQRDLTSAALISVSSYKPGFSIKQLLDSNLETFWQSDGPQPHYINFNFKKRTRINTVSVYFDFKQDESYSPKVISIRMGTNPDTLQEVVKQEFDEPSGWIDIPVAGQKTFMIQVAVLVNHQNGKDTHVRGIKLLQSIDPLEE